MRDRIKVTVPPSRIHLTEWEGVMTGDKLEVEDAGGRALKGDWIFRSAVCKPDTPDTIDHVQFLHVLGKRAPKIRAIHRERVRIPTQRVLDRQRARRLQGPVTG